MYVSNTGRVSSSTQKWLGGAVSSRPSESKVGGFFSLCVGRGIRLPAVRELGHGRDTALGGLMRH